MKVTEKGQVTIPKDIRDALGIDAGSRVDFEVRRGTIVLRKRTGPPSRGRQVVERMRGRGDVLLSTDEIMGLTREA